METVSIVIVTFFIVLIVSVFAIVSHFRKK